MDGIPEVADRASGLGTENGLELGEGEFDGVEVGGVRRQVQQPRPRRLDALADTADLVSGQIVEHDRVTGPEGWDEGLFDVVAEACARHRPVEEGGGHQAAGAEAGGDGDGLLMPERDRDPTALSAWSPSITTGHLGVGGGLVEEYEAVRVEIELALEPRQARGLHVLSFLLGGVASVFLRVMPWRLKKRDRLLTPTRKPCSARRSRNSRRNSPGWAS